MSSEHQDIEPIEDVRAVTAELMARMAIGRDGQPFHDNDPETWKEADEAAPEIVRLGQVRFRIVDGTAEALAIAAGVIEPDAPAVVCMRVAVEPGDGWPVLRLGQYVSIETVDPGVSVLFTVCLTHDALHAPDAPDLGPDAMWNDALDVLAAGEALLVQTFDYDDSEGA